MASEREKEQLFRLQPVQSERDVESADEQKLRSKTVEKQAGDPTHSSLDPDNQEHTAHVEDAWVTRLEALIEKAISQHHDFSLSPEDVPDTLRVGSGYRSVPTADDEWEYFDPDFKKYGRI